MRRTGRTPTLLALLTALLAPSSAGAAGLYIADVGAHGIGRAGAFIAAPDDLLALHYNPAALTLLGPGAHVTLNLVSDALTYDFQRTCPCVDPSLSNASLLDAGMAGRFTLARNSAAPQVTPYIAVAYQLPWYKLTLGLATYAVTSPGRLKYGERGLPGATLQPQRYVLVDLELFEAYYQLAVAVEPVQGLRIGFTGMLYDFNVQQALHLWANTSLNTDTSDPAKFEEGDWDVPVVISFVAPIRANWAAGISYTPTFLPQLSLGVSALGRRGSRSKVGTAAITLPEVPAAAVTIEGSAIEAELNLPASYRFGVQWDQPQLFEFEVALVIETWSAYDQVKIRGQDIFVINNASGARDAFGTVVLPTGFTDTYSLRFGGELKMLEPYVDVRAGFFYEPSAVPAQLQDVASPDLDKIGIAFGLGTTWYGMTLDLGINYVLYSERTITNSDRRLVPGLPTGPTTMLTTTGNGTYSGHHLILGAALSVAFDRLIASVSGDEEPPPAPNAAPAAEPAPLVTPADQP